MLKQLRRRWKILPAKFKVAGICAFLLAVFGLDIWIHLSYPAFSHAALGLILVPLFMAALLFGLKGGLACAALIGMERVLVTGVLTCMNPVVGFNTMAEVGVVFLCAVVTGVVSDRERREISRLKQAEELALLGTTAATVAHELKNPLVAIGGFAQRIYRDLEPGDPHRERLRIVVEQVAHMERLLREMLQFSRPMTLNREELLVNDLVVDVMTLAAQRAAQAKVGLKTDLDPRAGAVPMDGARVKQVLLNLILNALQASPPGEDVYITTHRNGSEVEITIKDHGPGISPQDRERVFLPFFTTKAKGTGLGLAVCHKVVEAHHGELSVRSSLGKGSAFIVILPAENPGG